MWTDPFWETVFRWATLVAAGAGGISITAAFVSAWVGYEITGATQRAADQRIALAQEQASKADERAALANERAARLMQIASWRHLTAEQTDAISRTAKLHPIRIGIAYTATDPESASYAWAIENAFKLGGCNVDTPIADVDVGARIGIEIRRGTNDDWLLAASAFANAGLSPYDVSVVGPPSAADALRIIIGNKMPPLAEGAVAAPWSVGYPDLMRADNRYLIPSTRERDREDTLAGTPH
jgi:hypothetical protein